MRDERQEDWGIFVHFFVGLSAAVSSLHKHAIQTLSIPPNTPHHTFIQTQVPRHHQNINKHCPHSPTQCSQTIITNHDSIPPHILPHTTPQFTFTLHPYSIHNYDPQNHFGKTMNNICAPERDTLPLLMLPWRHIATCSRALFPIGFIWFESRLAEYFVCLYLQIVFEVCKDTMDVANHPMHVYWRCAVPAKQFLLRTYHAPFCAIKGVCTLRVSATLMSELEMTETRL